MIVFDFHSISFNAMFIAYYFEYIFNWIFVLLLIRTNHKLLNLIFWKNCIVMMIVEISYRCKLDCYYIETSRPSFPNYGGYFCLTLLQRSSIYLECGFTNLILAFYFGSLQRRKPFDLWHVFSKKSDQSYHSHWRP